MNGLVARLAIPLHGTFRALLVVALCVSAVVLVGAVRERRIETVVAATSLDAATPVPDGLSEPIKVLASYGSAPDARTLLPPEPTLALASAAAPEATPTG